MIADNTPRNSTPTSHRHARQATGQAGESHSKRPHAPLDHRPHHRTWRTSIIDSRRHKPSHRRDGTTIRPLQFVCIQRTHETQDDTRQPRQTNDRVHATYIRPRSICARNVHQHDPVHTTYMQSAHPSPSAGTRRQSCAYSVREAPLIVCMARTSTRSCAYDVRETSQTRPPIYVPCTRSENRIRVMHTMPPSHLPSAVSTSADRERDGHWERARHVTVMPETLQNQGFRTTVTESGALPVTKPAPRDQPRSP